MKRSSGVASTGDGGQEARGTHITGIDVPFIDLTVFVFKLAMAGLLVGAVLAICWYVFRLLTAAR